MKKQILFKQRKMEVNNSIKECFLKAYLLYEEEFETQKDRALSLRGSNLEAILIDEFLEEKTLPSSHLILMLSLENIKKVINRAQNTETSIAILPIGSLYSIADIFDIPKDFEKALEFSLQKNILEVDVLRCDLGQQEEIVLFSSRVGEFPSLGLSSSSIKSSSRLEDIKNFFSYIKEMKNLRHFRLKITTAKDQAIESSALGLYILEYDNKSIAAKLLKDSLFAKDGKVSAVISSPISILSFLSYFFSSTFKKSVTLSDGVGYVKSESLSIETEPKMKLIIDSKEMEYEKLRFYTQKKSLLLNVGIKFKEAQVSKDEDSKDTVKVDNIPNIEDVEAIVKKPLPFFKRAGDKLFESVFTTLREDALSTNAFIVMMFLSSFIATLGIFLNSASVVIGAMLLAPLMSPIVSMSMGVLRRDRVLLKNSAISISIGVGVVLFASSLLAYLMPYQEMTDELRARLHPTLLDLGVAVFSGIAAAYTKYNKKVLSSVAGVAIAVALVPPLAVAGIGIGWMDVHVFLNASLLFLSNLFGIMLFSSLSFLAFGFSPIKKATSLWITVIIVFTISIPLYFSFQTILNEAKLKNSIKSVTIELSSGNNAIVEDMQIYQRGEVDIVRVTMLVRGVLSSSDIELIKNRLIQLDSRYSYELQIVYLL
ncbi:MAG: DUF389 domain-containing protein [Campylobacterales bacterium]